MHSGDSAMLVVTGIGLIVASLASFIGFSFAIGAFFAGLIFSSDPSAVKIDASFEALYELFVPFFFVGIGMTIEPAALKELGIPTLVLFLAAVMGKFLGAGIPAALTLNHSAAVLIGISMIPRAEISLIIAQRGFMLGEWAVSPNLFLWLVIISGATAVFVPVTLKRVIRSKSLKMETA
jgi:Kef-type K+ transport system membrane component KefB